MTDRIEEIRERLGAATPGPWVTRCEWCGPQVEMRGDDKYPYFPVGDLEDATFIAHCRDDMPFLLSELDTAREELAERKRACVVIGRGYRDLRAELAAARQWSAAWKHYAKWQRKLASLYKHYDWALDMQRMSDSLCRARWAHKRRKWDFCVYASVAEQLSEEIACQRQTIGLLVGLLSDATDMGGGAGIEEWKVEEQMAELGLTWADAIEEDGE